jgi:hypothetical protein
MEPSRLLKHSNYPVHERLEGICMDPSNAQFHLWLRQMQRDHGVISDKEMAIAESVAAPMAQRSRTIFNPFTGEIRRENIQTGDR